MTSTALVLIVALVVAALAVAAIVALRRRPASDPALVRLVEQQAEIAGRLAQMAGQSSAAQEHIDRRLDERFTAIDRRLGDGLERSAQTVVDLRERLVRIDAAQKTIAELSTNVVSLQDILSNKQARGAFGEDQLEALVRDLLPSEYYAFQHTLAGGKRVDCLLKLPPPVGPLAVDAKFPREAWDALRAAPPDAPAQEAARRAFGTAILKHVKDIQSRYIVAGETADAALMFVPSESVFAEIHGATPEVVEQGRRMRVFIVSPTTLWAVLNTMRAVVRDAKLRDNAHLIHGEIGKLLADLDLLGQRVEAIDKHFGLAAEDLRKLKISADRLRGRGERMRDVELGEAEPEPRLTPPGGS